MVVSNPTLLLLNPQSPLSLSYIYLFNTERSSSGVRINDLADGLECAVEMMKCATSTSSPSQGL